jgi:hypothetical protein
MVSVPVSEMFDFWMRFLDLSEYSLLVFPVLEEAGRGPLRAGARA